MATIRFVHVHTTMEHQPEAMHDAIFFIRSAFLAIHNERVKVFESATAVGVEATVASREHANEEQCRLMRHLHSFRGGGKVLVGTASVQINKIHWEIRLHDGAESPC